MRVFVLVDVPCVARVALVESFVCRGCAWGGLLFSLVFCLVSNVCVSQRGSSQHALESDLLSLPVPACLSCLLFCFS